MTTKDQTSNKRSYVPPLVKTPSGTYPEGKSTTVSEITTLGGRSYGPS